MRGIGIHSSKGERAMNSPTLTLTELYQLEWLRHARLLPNGAGLVFIVTRVVDDVEKFDVRTVALDGSGMRTVAKDLESISGLCASPDGQVWACIAPIKGKAQIAFMNPETGALRGITSLPQGVGGPLEWSPCGQWIAFTAVGEERVAKGPFDPVRTSSVKYKADGAGFVQRVAQDIFVLSRQWCEVKRLTHGPASHAVAGWSPIEGRLEMIFTTGMEPEGLDITMSVGVVDLQGQIRWVRRHLSTLGGAATFAGDGDRVLLVNPLPDSGYGEPIRLVVKALAAGEDGVAESRTDAFTRDTDGGQALSSVISTQMGMFAHRPISPVGTDYALVGCQVAGFSSVRRIALSGPESVVAITPTDSGHFLVDADADHVLTAHTHHNSQPDLYISDHQGKGRRQLTALNAEFLATRALPTVHELNFKSADGARLQAWLIRPPGSTGPVPTYLDIHGGPQGAWGPSWLLQAQALAGIGIATLMPNPRGSAGYGQAHAATIFGRMVQPADADLLAAVDEAVRQGLADPDRLGIGGVSYGGLATAWIIGQTDRFKCAIPEQLICNFISAYGESDAGRWLGRHEFGVTLKDGFELLWKYSPLAHAHKVKTPTLIIQNENDFRCPMGEGEQFFMALKEAGCTAEFMRIPGASHGATQFAGITKMSRPRDEAVMDWLTCYLKG